ncbi:hypothetical protein HZS_7671 [Henneguya salminicola]|nr:hypothetical protein HZS_7671 [Henneguya salminicola]
MRLINGVPSTPIRFHYENFTPVDRLFCKYTNSSKPFASFNITLGTSIPRRVLIPISSDYSIVNQTIGVSGYFGLKIKARIDRDDGNSILCQYSTKFTIGSSSIINLNVISPMTITPFMSPQVPIIGERVTAGCIVEGYPYPTVEIETPKNTQYVATQLNPSNTKLTSYKYAITIPSIDESWNGQRVYCSAIQNGGKLVDNYVTIRLGDVNGFSGSNPAVVTAIVIGSFAALSLIVLSLVFIVALYKKKYSSREKYIRNRYEARGVDSRNKTSVEENPDDYLFSPISVELIERNENKVIKPADKFTNSYEVSTAAFV